MSDLDYLNLSDGFVTDPGADDFVHADQLAAAVINGCQCWINLIIDRLNIITNEENQLRDDIVRLRNLSAEVLTALGTQWDVMVECRLATTGPVLLSGLAIIDGTLPQEGDVVLVKDQADASTNGPYVASAGLWSRWPGMVDGDGVDNVYAWVTEGAENSYTSFVSQGEDRTVGSSDYLFVICHKEFVPNLTADILDALQGTAGSPDNANRFVTDEDPRLDVFTAGQIGVVPDPFGFDCEYFLCADGTWQKPSEVAAEGFMRVDLDNIMDADGEITFPDTVGIHGLADPVAAGDAVNLNYFDTAVTAILATLVGLTDWKQDLDAIDGVIGCDGSGNYAEVTDPTFASATITGKLTVGGLIDPTGLQLTQVDANPGDANTLWVDDSNGHLWLGAADIVQAIIDSQTDATQALANAAAAQGTADAAKAVTDALDALNGIIQCDGAGNFSVWSPVSSAVTDDSTYGGGGQSVATSIDALAAAVGAANSHGEISGVPANIIFGAPLTWTQVLLPGAGGDRLTNMTQLGNGIRADKPMEVVVVAQVSADLNAAQQCQFAFAVNGVIVPESVAEQHYPGVGSQYRNTAVVKNLSLALNDVVTLWAQQMAGTATLAFSNCNMAAKE